MTDSAAIESTPASVLIGSQTEDKPTEEKNTLENDMSPPPTFSNGDNEYNKKRPKEESSSNIDDTTDVQHHKRPRNEDTTSSSQPLDILTSTKQIDQKDEDGIKSSTIDENYEHIQQPDEQETNRVMKDSLVVATATTTSQSTTTGEDGQSPLLNGNGKKRPIRRWRTHQMAEDYVDFVGNVMYPGIIMGPYGYNAPHENQYPLERITSLGYLQSPLRRPTVIEKWSPYEIAMFEAALFQYGKLFHKIQKEVSTKTTKDVVEFYYVWKKTTHYRKWKDQYVPGIGDSSDEEEKEEADNDTGGRRRV